LVALVARALGAVNQFVSFNTRQIQQLVALRVLAGYDDAVKDFLDFCV
jgi:hypothetical protein